MGVVGITQQRTGAMGVATNASDIALPYSLLALNPTACGANKITGSSGTAVTTNGTIHVDSSCPSRPGAIALSGNGVLNAPQCDVVGFIDTAVGAEKSGLKAVVDFTRLDVPYTSIGLIASRGFLGEHLAEWRAFERAVNQALRRLRDDPAFAARVLGQYLEIQDADVLRQTADEAVGYLNGELRLDRAGLENTRVFASYGIPALRDFDVASMLP